MAVRRAVRRGGRGWRPATFWDGVVPTASSVVPANNKLLLASFLPQDDLEVTVRRIRGRLMVGSDQVAASEDQLGALGAGIFSATAITAGVASLPDPVTDVGSDVWQLYVHIGQNVQFLTAAGIRPDFLWAYEFDSKAMRRIPEGYGIAFVVANASATHGMRVSMGMRLLSSLTGR